MLRFQSFSKSVGAIVRTSDNFVLGTFFLAAPKIAVSSAHVLAGLSSSEFYLTLGGEVLRLSPTLRVVEPLVYFSVESGKPLDWISLEEEPFDVGNNILVPGFSQGYLGDDFVTLRVISTFLMGIQSKGAFRDFLEAQGGFPVGYSGAPVVSGNGLLLGVIDGLITFSSDSGRVFEFSVAFPASKVLLSPFQ